MANLWVDSVKHCVGNLTRFSGRDRPGLFWPYAGSVVAADIIIWFLAVSAAMSKVRSIMVQPASGSASFSANADDLFFSLLLVMAVILLVTCLLLAAAVVRRLHDRGSSGWWGFLPLPFLLIGLGGMTLIRSATADGTLPSGLFALMGLNNIAYLVAIVVLIVMLAWSSEPRDNRYGPASVRAAWTLPLLPRRG